MLKIEDGPLDSSKGEFRLCGITAGIGGRSYMNYPKAPAKVSLANAPKTPPSKGFSKNILHPSGSAITHL